jgi:hypothetical protein
VVVSGELVLLFTTALLFYGLLARYNYTVHPKDGGFSFLIARDCIRTFSQSNLHSCPRISNWLLSRREGSPFSPNFYSTVELFHQRRFKKRRDPKEVYRAAGGGEVSALASSSYLEDGKTMIILTAADCREEHPALFKRVVLVP